MKTLICRLKNILLCSFALALAACDDGTNFAPVMEVNAFDPMPKTGYHQVSQGETLYAIAWRYGLDYRYLAMRNHIRSPYAIHVGQKLYLKGGNATVIAISEPNEPVSAIPVSAPVIASTSIKENQAIIPRQTFKTWAWPVKGKVIDAFSKQHNGINIAGKVGEAVYATAAGKVVYCGNGLRGYGNLIIIKHNSLYLSAYAHNNHVFVREGDSVIQGQKIADMGSTGTNKVMLHFEIRHAGKPVNPISLLDG